jgi:hypothetical protein
MTSERNSSDDRFYGCILFKNQPDSCLHNIGLLNTGYTVLNPKNKQGLRRSKNEEKNGKTG